MQCNRIQELYQLFKGMANKKRLVMLENLMEKEMNVSELAILLDVSQSNASHNLSILKKCGLVSMRKSGKHRIVTVNKETVDMFFRVASNHFENKKQPIIV